MLGLEVHPFLVPSIFPDIFGYQALMQAIAKPEDVEVLHIHCTSQPLTRTTQEMVQNKFLVMVIRILGMHAVNTVNINTYRFIECFPMMHIRMYMYDVCGEVVGICQGWVTAPWEFRQWTEDRSRCASSLCVIVVHWFALLCTKDCCCRTSFILWTVVARWLYVVVLHHLVNNPADESTLRAVIEWI